MLFILIYSVTILVWIASEERGVPFLYPFAARIGCVQVSASFHRLGGLSDFMTDKDLGIFWRNP